MELYANEIKTYRQLNQVAHTGGVVLFGSSFAKNIPVNELKQDFDLDCNLYNRSLADLSVFDAASVLSDCVINLAPSKVLIQLGETDLEHGFRSISEIVAQYELIINQIRTCLRGCSITLISVCDPDTRLYPEELNGQLKVLAEKTGCQYADLSPALSNEAPAVKAFDLLKRFFRNRLSEYDALNMRFA